MGRFHIELERVEEDSVWRLVDLSRVCVSLILDVRIKLVNGETRTERPHKEPARKSFLYC